MIYFNYIVFIRNADCFYLRVELTLRPAPVNTGIVFRRTDLAAPVTIAVRADSVNDTRLATTLTQGDVRVRTIEHLMSACAGVGIDNLYIDITAEEVPILDDSASAFVYLLQNASKIGRASCRERV